MFNIIGFIFSFFDPRIVPWIFVLNIFGYWIKKTGWAPRYLPLPAMIFLLSFAVSAVFGWITTDAQGIKAIIMAICYYGVGNGLLIGFMATFGYDVVHNIIKAKGAVNGSD